MKIILVTLSAFAALACAQREYTTPVPILKQINRHNEDGSYSYGYEAADQSFKIETKYPNGEVYGKYGYVDDQGKLREVEYGASQRGFEPQGSDINVPPPTLVNNNKNAVPLGPNEVDDGQYREDPAIYYNSKSQYNSKPLPASNFRLNGPPAEPRYQPQPQYQPQYQAPAQPKYQSQYQPQYNPPQPAYRPPQPQYNPPQPQYNPPQQQHYNAPQSNWNQQYQSNSAWNNHHHPALSNIDIASGSYSVSYTGR